MLKSEYLTLQEIRKRQEVTQADIAGLLGIKQENVSRLEKRNDMKLSTLTDYIEALGGHIQIRGHTQIPGSCDTNGPKRIFNHSYP